MAPASNEEQFKFLISCIRYSNNGKVDFGQVAKECKIVSKGAAAKRYERMMKSHGIAANAASVKPTPSRNTTKNEHREAGSGATIKKRKTDAFLDEANTADDEEGGYASSIKAESGGLAEDQLVVKEEVHQVGQLTLNEATDLMKYYDSPTTYAVEKEESLENGGNTYSCGDYGGVGFGYASSSPVGNPYVMQSLPPYDFSLPFGGMGMSSIPGSEHQDMNYPAMLKYSQNDQGRSDRPVILE